MDEHLISHIEQIGKEEGGGWNRIAYTGFVIAMQLLQNTEGREKGEWKTRAENERRPCPGNCKSSKTMRKIIEDYKSRAQQPELQPTRSITYARFVKRKLK